MAEREESKSRQGRQNGHPTGWILSPLAGLVGVGGREPTVETGGLFSGVPPEQVRMISDPICGTVVASPAWHLPRGYRSKGVDLTRLRSSAVLIFRHERCDGWLATELPPGRNDMGGWLPGYLKTPRQDQC